MSASFAGNCTSTITTVQVMMVAVVVVVAAAAETVVFAASTKPRKLKINCTDHIANIQTIRRVEALFI